MSSMALNQVAKCLQSSCIWQLRTYIQFFFSESPVLTCNLRTFSSLLQWDDSYEHWDVHWNTNTLCATLKALQHPKELGYFFILEPKQVALQTPEGEHSATQWCAGSKGSVLSLWAHSTLDCHHFLQNMLCVKLVKGTLMLSHVFVPKHKNAQRVKHHAKHCRFFSSLCLLEQIKLRREEWAEEEGDVNNLRRMESPTFC